MITCNLSKSHPRFVEWIQVLPKWISSFRKVYKVHKSIEHLQTPSTKVYKIILTFRNAIQGLNWLITTFKIHIQGLQMTFKLYH